MRKIFFLIIVAAGTLFSFFSFSKKKKQTKPNIIYIMADDMGYGDISAFGQKGYATPNIDQLAKKGMSFSDYYVQPSCTATRASLMTGAYPYRVGLNMVVAPSGPAWTLDKADKGLNEKETTIAEVLKNGGYKTALFGKWHLGHHHKHLPTNQGFDYFYGTPYSHDMNPNVNKTFPDMPWMENEKVLEYNPDLTNVTKDLTERAIDFMEENKNKPFFLYVAHPMPHIPLHVSKEFDGITGKGMYADAIKELDWSVGQIVQKVKDMDMLENTIIVFTSDNGPWLLYGNHGGSPEPFFNGKHSNFEGGQRVPFIVSWKGKVPEDKVNSNISGVIDILPTFANLSGSELPESKMDGIDISNMMFDEKEKGREYQFFGNGKAVAVRKGKWKLHIPHKYIFIADGAEGHDGMKGKEAWKKLELSLYDVSTDLKERTNVADQNPEIVQELKAAINAHNIEIEKNKRPVGVAEPYVW